MDKTLCILPVDELSETDKKIMKNILCHKSNRELWELIITLGDSYGFKIMEIDSNISGRGNLAYRNTDIKVEQCNNDLLVSIPMNLCVFDPPEIWVCESQD